MSGAAIYLDHNATNPADERVLDAWRRGLVEGWANPSSIHGPGRKARALVEEAREQVATLAGVTPGQVTFTASGTEALNQAIHSVLRPGKAPVVVASAVEHPAVLEPLAALEAEGRARRVLAPVDRAGRIDVAALEALLARRPGSPGRPGSEDDAVALVALLAAQTEVGTLQPLEEVGRVAAAANVPLLVDACTAAGRVARDWARTPWDYLVLSGQKLRAPRGAAALLHRGRAPEPRRIIHGGAQERGRRAGTEDTCSILALGAACELARRGELLDAAALLRMRERFEERLVAAIPGLEVVARDAERLPQTTSVLVPGGDSEALLAGLDLAGVAASAGSACASGALERAHVLAALGVDPVRARGRLRFSFGPETTEADLERAVEVLAGLAPRSA